MQSFFLLSFPSPPAALPCEVFHVTSTTLVLEVGSYFVALITLSLCVGRRSSCICNLHSHPETISIFRPHFLCALFGISTKQVIFDPYKDVLANRTR